MDDPTRSEPPAPGDRGRRGQGERKGEAAFLLHITEVAFGGRGVGRLEDGRVVFVPFVAAGETAWVEIVRAHRSYLEARLLGIEGPPSPHRVEPPCPYFGRCGGCSYQHLSHAEQLRVKQGQVAQSLRRIGRFDAPPVEAVVPSPLTYEYRNRVTVHAREGRIGFFGQNRAELIDIERCPIAEPEVNAALSRLRAGPPPQDGNYTLRTDPNRRAFQQTNDSAAAEMLALVERLLPSGGAHLIDAYCGAGFFIKRLRERFARVTGLEWSRRAIYEARIDALPHERYLCGDVAEHLGATLLEAPSNETALITDPPAEGLAEAVRAAIAGRPPAHWLYVSCNPATLARDLAALRDAFELVSVTPLDMFPQTAEIEVIALLRGKG